MSRAIKFSFCIIILTFLLLLNIKAFACSCVPQDERLENAVSVAHHQYDLVFYAIASKISVEQDKKQARSTLTIETTKFDTLEVFKGQYKPQYLTKVNTTCCVCGYSFTEGKKYLVYAMASEDGFYHVSTCSRTKSIEAENPELSLLRESKSLHSW